MFKGEMIPGILNVPGVLDRTIWVFKHRYFPYGMIFLATFGPCFLLMFALYQFGILNLDLGANFGIFLLSNYVILIVFLYLLPSTVSDLAMQYYTSYLVRNNEIKWWTAIRKAFSTKLLKYLLVKLIGGFVLTFVSLFASVILLVPVVGPFVWFYLMLGITSAIVGMTPGIIVEEKKDPFSVVGRNFHLGRAALGNVFNSSALGGIVMMAFVASMSLLFQSLAAILIAIFFADTDWNMGKSIGEEILTTAILLLAPMVMLLITVPLQSIFFSVLYYNMRSRREAFHLENRLNIYNQQFEVEVKE